MKLQPCLSCNLPVVELEGQFSVLDSFYIHDDVPSPETSGWWHASCLAGAASAPVWYEARLRNYRDVRRYLSVAELSDWTILREPNRGKLLAFGRNGQILDLSRGKRKSAQTVEGGHIYQKIEEAFHLELDDMDLVLAIQEGLLRTKSYPLLEVLKGIGVADRMVHQEAVEKGVLRLDEALKRDWDRRSVSARAEYGVFVPLELDVYVGEFVR
jgi:hypothetical protein